MDLPVNPSLLVKPTCLRSRPPDRDPMDQIRPFSFPARFCLRNPKFSKITTRSFHLRKILTYRSCFLHLARQLNFYLQNSPKTCFSHNLVVLALFLAFFLSTRSSRRVEQLFAPVKFCEYCLVYCFLFYSIVCLYVNDVVRRRRFVRGIRWS
jgi:hypothetical protein